MEPQPSQNKKGAPMKTVLRALLRGKYTLLAVVAAVTLTSASVALAGSGVNGVFNLGVTNTVNAITTLVSGAAGVGPAGPMLRIDNNSTNAAATALELLVEPGKAPMKTNSGTKVTNLNADRLDGQDSTTIGRERWAVVNPDGTLARGRGNPTVTYGGIGAYTVKFGSTVSNCAYTATTALPGGPSYATVFLDPADGSVVHVFTFDGFGNPTDLPFHLIVAC